MSLNELKAFDAVARAGGFVRAAEMLNRSQPTVTAQVRNLERRYKIELFFRNRGQAARLTPLGERLFETTRQMFNLEGDAEGIIAEAAKMKGGVLRLGAISPRWASGLMDHMMSRYPDLELGLAIDNSQSLLAQVLDYGIDIAFIGAHVFDPSCHMQLVSRPEIAFIAVKDHPLSAHGRITREQFSKATLVNREPGSETRVLMEASMEAHDYRPSRTVGFGNREGALIAAEQGLGLAPTSVEEIPSGANVCVLRAADFSTYGEIHAICLKSRRRLPIIKEAFEQLSASEGGKEPG